MSPQKLGTIFVSKVNLDVQWSNILDAVGSWQIILPMPNLERAY